MNLVPIRKIEVSVAAEIQQNKKTVSHGAKTARLIFDNAHHRSDLDIAIARNPKSALSLKFNCRWTPLKVQQEGKEEQTVYVNINSLSKRLGLSKSKIQQAIREHSLEALVSEQLRVKVAELDFAPIEMVPALHLRPLRLHSFINRLKGALVDAWWRMTTGSWDLFRLRFMLGASDEQLQAEGKLRAHAAFHQAYERVPAYRQFIDENASHVDGKASFPKRFDQIPVMGKKEYIQKVQHVDDLYLDGKIPANGQLDSSTGTTGEPALWMRSVTELAMTQKLMSFAKKAKFGDEDVILINTFALGLWATGITIAGAGPNHGLTANVGIVSDYAEKAIAIIKQLSAKNSHRPIVLCGYPPNIRNIADAIQKDPELQGRNLQLHALVGGEAMTEDLRQDILNKGFKNVSSSYGASDLDINIGYETETEVTIRRACIENPALAKELYGGGPPPMVFHYDPLHYFIETTSEGELLYTCCRKERASPRIRYNLHDTGKVMMAKDVVAILKKYGVEISPRTNLPFLFIHGREGTVSYGGSKIHYEHLELGIRELDGEGLINRDRFALFKPEENQLEFWIEASSEEAFEELNAEIDQLQRKLVDAIAKSNTDFKKILDGRANPYPQIKLFKPKQSPMSIHAAANPHRKLQRVVANSEELQRDLNSRPDCFTASSGDYI